MQTLEAIYTKGVFQPTTALRGISEGQHVRLIVHEMVQELVPEGLKRREAELLRRMEADGALVHFPVPTEPRPADWRPLVMEGEPFSEEVIRMRGERG
jgi:predicted DNA-binding antitoxin AbrB/MazE fold protein